MLSFKNLIIIILKKLKLIKGVHYINGPETLPAPLSQKEEENIINKIKLGDTNARELLVIHNLRLVVYIAKKFESSNLCVEDLVSIGTIG